MSVTEATQDKAVRAPAGTAKPPRKFAGVVIVTTGLPARGKSQVAHSLKRRLNWNGESAKGKKFLFFVFVLVVTTFIYTLLVATNRWLLGIDRSSLSYPCNFLFDIIYRNDM